MGNVQRVRDLGTLSPKWCVYIKSFPFELKELSRTGGKILRARVDGWKQCLLDTTGLTCVSGGRETTELQSLEFQVRWGPNFERGSGTSPKP